MRASLRLLCTELSDLPSVLGNRLFSTIPTLEHSPVKFVFLGAPGVGKGTYCSRIAKALQVPHIAAGDLVREEIKAGTDMGRRMEGIVKEGGLLPDTLVSDLVLRRLQRGAAGGERGYVLDGYPRTRVQADILGESLTPLTPDLAVNLSVREEVLVEKCLGRRICGKCGRNYNVANIYLPASKGGPEIVMPPLNPPQSCEHSSDCHSLMTVRADDTEAVVRRRLETYRREARPVEDYYASRGLLLDFEITGGIPETLPRLLKALAPHIERARGGGGEGGGGESDGEERQRRTA